LIEQIIKNINTNYKIKFNSRQKLKKSRKNIQ